VLRRELRARCVTTMPGTKAFTVLRDVLLDGHVRITKAHELHLPALLSQDSGLLRGAWRRFRLVVPGKFLASVGDHWLSEVRTTQLEG